MVKLGLSRVFKILTLVSILIVLGIDTGKTIYMDLNGVTTPVKTTAILFQQLLHQEDLAIKEGDQISPPISSWLKDGDTVSIQQGMQIFIQADETEQTLLTTHRKPAEVLKLAEITLHPEDLLLVNGFPTLADEKLPVSDTHSLQVIRAHHISLSVDNEVQTFYSSASTVGQALWEQGIYLYDSDILDPSPETPLNNDTSVTLIPSKELLIQYDEGQLKVRTSATSVGEVLTNSGIPLQNLDYTTPPADAPLPSNGQVRLVRVEETITLETDPIPFNVQYQPLSNLEIDNQTIVQTGQYGLLAQRIRIRLEDGEMVSHQVEGEFISKEPQVRIIGYGTEIVPRTLDTPAGSIQYWRALHMYAVSYNPTSAGGTITASGLPLRKGLVAVDPTLIPLGTRLYVPGYGDALAADTGGGVRGRMIDLGYSDDDYEHWSSWVTVYFLWPPPENIVWIIP